MRRRRSIRSVLLSAALVSLWYVLLAPPALGGRTSYISVSGHSMEPTYFTGDLVVVRKADGYRAGDIVAFKAQGGVVIHRITGGDSVSGYVTEGDNNSWTDPWRPTDHDVVGRAWFRLPGASRWLLTLTQPAAVAVVVTVLLALGLRSDKTRNRSPIAATTSRPSSTPTRRPMQLDTLRRYASAVPRRTRAASIAALLLAGVTAVPAVLAWTDDVQRTSFHQDASYLHAVDFSYTFRLDPTTLYPDGVIGPIDATTSKPPTIFAKPARAMDVQIDYRFDADRDAPIDGTVAVDAVVSGDAGWSTTLQLAEPSRLDRRTTRIEVPLDLGTVRELVARVGDETGMPSSRYEISIVPTFHVRSTVADTAVDEQYSPSLAVSYTGTTWTVGPQLHAEKTQRLGSEVTERVQLAGIDVALLRWAVAPATALLLLAVGLVALAVGRVPRLTVDALLRRPGIAVIDLERPPADADLAVPLTSAEGIRRVAERDGGLVLRYEHDGDTLLYARHDNRVYCYSAGDAHR
jgi:signal peptidase I